MAQLAIKGHSNRGKEVIEILEMLGGKISRECGYEDGFYSHYAYFIDTNENYFIDGFLIGDKNPTEFSIFTLEEFLEKFPYKVGDRVMTDDGDRASIVGMVWDNDINDVFYEIQICNEVFKYPKELLQPYEEETFGECIEKTIQECLFGHDEDTMVKENYSPISLLPLANKVMIVPTNKDSEIIEENGKFYLVKKQPQYPKTYEECCDILQLEHTFELKDLTMDEEKLMDNFIRLKRCRDAYWQIAGEELGLDNSWEPKWEIDNVKYSILVVENEIRIGDNEEIQRLLVFPTEEMRDAFYENFKALINEVKTLL